MDEGGPVIWWLEHSGLLLVCAATAYAIGGSVWIWRVRRALVAVTLRGVRLEVHGARPVEDLVIETMWRSPLSMTNRSRGPRRLPVIASRATVLAGGKTYLASVYVECDAQEVSPEQLALAWAEFVLPSGVEPQVLAVAVLDGNTRPHSLRFLLNSRPYRSSSARVGSDEGDPTTQFHQAHRARLHGSVPWRPADR